MIRTCLFDLGNVLVHFSHEQMCRQMAVECGVDARTLHVLLFDSGVLAEFERGRISEDDLLEFLQQQTGCRPDRERLFRAASDIFTLNEPMLPVLEALRNSGRRLVLLSNTSVSHLRWVRERFTLLEHFDALVTSCEAGAIKPEPAIFEAALAAIHCEPGECFYTDDIPAYVEAGRTWGLQAEVFEGTDRLRAHLRERGVDVALE